MSNEKITVGKIEQLTNEGITVGLSAVDRVVSLPVYESKATPEQREDKLKWMQKQLKTIDAQAANETHAKYTKIRCGCNKFVIWKYMYRCLYCGIWYCKECAQEHFGMRAN